MESAQASASERSCQQAEADDARSLDRVRIGEALVREGVLSREQLDFALRVQAKLRYHELLDQIGRAHV